MRSARTTHRVSFLVALLGVIAIGAWSLLRPQPLEAAADPEQELRAALGEHSIEFEPPGADDKRAALILPEDAIAKAREEYAPDKGAPARAYLGRFSDWAMAEGGTEGGSLPPAQDYNQLIYFVQFTGLELLPTGPVGAQLRPHEEMIVFVDAISGGVIGAIHFR